MKVKVHLKVNGLAYEIEVEPRRTLLELIREDLELTGTKEGCGWGNAGPVRFCLTGSLSNPVLPWPFKPTGVR